MVVLLNFQELEWALESRCAWRGMAGLNSLRMTWFDSDTFILFLHRLQSDSTRKAELKGA